MITKPSTIYTDARRRNITVTISLPQLKRRIAISKVTTAMSGSYLYLAALLRLSLTSTSTATTTEEINSSCTPATPFTKYHGGNNKFFPFPFNYLIVFG